MRMRRYLDIRNSIFSEHQLGGMSMVSRKVQKARDRFRKRRNCRREAVAAVKCTLSWQRAGRGLGCVRPEVLVSSPYGLRGGSVNYRTGQVTGGIPRTDRAHSFLLVSLPGAASLFWSGFLASIRTIGPIDPEGVKKAEELHARDMEHYAEVEDDDEEKTDPESWTLSKAEEQELDARKLNDVTIKDAYPLPSIDGILSRIEQTYYISSVDLKFAFWRIELDTSSKEYTVFTVPGRPLYQFRVMPFGLCNASQRLVRLMDLVIPAEIRSNVFVYLDDLLILAPDIRTHLKYLRRVAECLKEAGSLTYLGFIVGGGRLRMDPGRVVTIRRMPEPRTMKEVRAFLGTAGWYRRFIKNFATLAALFSLSPEAQLAVDSLKMALTQLNFNIEHRKGSENVVADTLSRCVEELTVDPSELLGFEMDGLIFKRVSSANLDDEVEGFEWKLWISQSLTHSIIERAHSDPTAAHGGMGKTLENLRRQFYWPGMALQVRESIRRCEVCKETKSPNFRMQVGIGERVQTEQPFQKLYIDFLGKYPKSKKGQAYIFIVVDHFSKYTFWKAMQEASASNVVEFLIHEVFYKFGVPEIVHSDNGRQFTSKIFEEAMESFGITHIKTPVHSPQSNAAERVNQSVLAAIRSYLEEDHREWDAYLPEIEVALRNAVHSATGEAPFFTVFGRHMFLNGASYKLARKLKSLCDHEMSGMRTADKLQLIQDKPGQEVYRRNFAPSDFKKAFNAKFARKFLKARVVKTVGNKSYELEDLQGRSIGVYHAKDIRL
ncbi:uncharacterized protein K02A2.6-like [Drosophila elegans]|uniref:uncharacterized protein K02A2.6-like n=1 Tax=Drosophila elegans TaxID=30023 RepID=UPI001BC858AF|nr:uncharacterized protein K02A2.6-like [Drosophila elegans]